MKVNKYMYFICKYNFQSLKLTLNCQSFPENFTRVPSIHSLRHFDHQEFVHEQLDESTFLEELYRYVGLPEKCKPYCNTQSVIYEKKKAEKFSSQTFVKAGPQLLNTCT